MMNSRTKIGLVPNVRGVGGMVSFRYKLTAGLNARGIDVTSDLDDPDLKAVLVIAGTRDLASLRRARKRGVRIVQRLDGMNWMHRQMFTGIRHFIRSETGNWLLQTIRRFFVDAIVYQSNFSKEWWEREYGSTRVENFTVYNAVDLEQYSPEGQHERPSDHYRVLLVEGSLQGGYETGLQTAVEMTRILKEIYNLPVRLAVAGKVSQEVVGQFSGCGVDIDWLGLVAREQIPQIDRSAHILFSADLNAACPNSVIEALACGLPVAAFDTGALPELVDNDAGCIVPYGGNPWKLDPPDVHALAEACARALNANDFQRRHARKRAETLFGLDRMVESYLEALQVKTDDGQGT